MFEIKEIYQDIKNGMSIEKVHKKYGGFKIYIPKVCSDYKEKIIKEFNGYNQAVLASKYNVSINQVYAIVKKHKKIQKEKEK